MATVYASETPDPTVDLHDRSSSTNSLILVDTVVPSVTPSAALTTSAFLPDLIVSYAYLEMLGRAGNCVNQYSAYEIRVVVKNGGSAPANGFEIEFNGVRQSFDGQLLPDQIQVFYFSGVPSNGAAQAIVDVTNRVMESNESNNTNQYVGVTPTPPLLCTPTSTPAA